MIRECITAVVARNEAWSGASVSEPYECGWAGEAMVWLRILAVSGAEAPLAARVQVSPDGLHWLDEGSTIELPAGAGALGLARVRHFGNWLRLAATLPDGTVAKVLVTLTLKA
jgi:hypothetical protein